MSKTNYSEFVLVKTSKKFFLIDPISNAYIRSNRPTVVPRTGFISEKIAEGILHLVVDAVLKSPVSDDLFEEIIRDCTVDGQKDYDYSIAVLLSELGIDTTGKPSSKKVERKVKLTPDESKADENKPAENKGDESKADENKADEEADKSADENKADENKGDENKPDESKADENKPAEPAIQKSILNLGKPKAGK